MGAALGLEVVFDGEGVVEEAIGHFSDAVDEGFFVDLNFGGELLPVAHADVAEAEFAADLHGELDAAGVDAAVVEDAGGIVEGGEADVAAGAEEEGVVFGVALDAADEPVEDDGVDEAEEVGFGVGAVLADELGDADDAGATVDFVAAGGVKADGLAGVLLVDAEPLGGSTVVGGLEGAVVAVEDDGDFAGGVEDAGGGDVEAGGAGKGEAEVLIFRVARPAGRGWLEDVGGGGEAGGDSPAAGVAVERDFGQDAGEGELARIAGKTPGGGVGAQSEKAEGEVGFREVGERGGARAGEQGGEPLGVDELHGAGAILANVGDEIEDALGGDAEAACPLGEDAVVVGEQAPEKGVDAGVGMLGDAEGHGEGERKGAGVAEPVVAVGEGELTVLFGDRADGAAVEQGCELSRHRSLCIRRENRINQASGLPKNSFRSGMKMRADEGGGFGEGGGGVAEALDPMDIGLAAKPGELTLGVVAMALLGGGDGLGKGELAAEVGGGLAVAERIERGNGAVAGEEAAGFFDEACGEHGFGALVEALVELGAGGIEADAEETEAGEGIAALGEGGGDRLAEGEADLDGADELGGVVGVNALGGEGVEAGEDAVQPAGAVAGEAAGEAGAEMLLARRAGEEAEREGAQVKAGAAGDDGEMAAGGDGGEGGAGLAAVFAGGVEPVGVGDVDEVVGQTALVIWGWFRGAEVEAAVYGDGVATDDFALETLAECEGEGGFAAAGGAEEEDGERVGLGIYHRHHPLGKSHAAGVWNRR